MNTLRKYAMGLGENLPIQQVVDYGAAGLVGAGAQQLNNMVLDGSDPNPLLSGALFAPLGTAMLRGSRSLIPNATQRNFDLNMSSFQNPYSAAAYNASLAGAVAGAGTSIYNTLAGGDDVDNNLVAAGVGTLGAIAPIAYSMMRSKSSPALPRTVYTMPSTSSGRYRAEEYTGVPSGYPRASANPDNLYQRPTSSARTVDVPVEAVTRPSIMRALPYQKGGELALRDPNLPTTSRVVVPPLTVNELALNATRGRGWNVGKEFPMESALAGLYSNAPRLR